MTTPSELRQVCDRYRVIVVRAQGARWRRRWLWSTEEDKSGRGWDLRKQGTALTNASARRKAHADIELATSYLIRDRFEHIIAIHWSYEPKPKQESPLVQDAAPLLHCKERA